MTTGKTILIIAGIIIGMLLIIAGGVYGDSQNFSQPVTLPEKPVSIEGKQGKCGDGICDAKEKANPDLCPQDCKPIDNKTETCGQDNNGYCIDFREECKTGYEDIGPDTCRRGRSAGCCVPESLAKKTCAELNGTICSSSQTCSGSWLDASDSGWCCDGVCENSEVNYDDSPFGISIGGFLSNQDYKKSLHYMNEAGADTVRFMSKWGGLNWERIEPQKGVFDWSKTDEYYSEAIKNNLDIMVNIYPDNPEWDDPNNPYTMSVPIDMDEYLIFIRKAVEHYPEVETWILGVELERGNDKKWWTGTPEEYADLFVKTYTAIKSVNPDAIVMTYGTNIYLNRKRGEIDIFTKPVLAEIKKLTKGTSDFSFVYAIHYYKTHDITLHMDILSYTRSMLDESGFTETPIVMTDMAPFFWNDEDLREQKLAKHIIKTYTVSFAHDVKKIVWAQLSDGYGYDDGKQFEAGLITKDSQHPEGYYKNLGFYTYKLMVEKLEGSDWDNIQIIQESDNVYIYKFMKNGEPVWVAWWDYFDDSGTSKTITLDVGNMDAVKITEAVPDAEDGSKIDENDYPNFFKTEAKTTSGGRVEITLGESPVFVEEIKGGEPEEKTCSELNGKICSSSQTCSGSWLDASDSERCCDGACENSVVDYEDSPYSFFFVHAEVSWSNLNKLVELADKYNVPLTIMFWPTFVDKILENQERIITVKSWQANGHEIGIHVQYDDQGGFDPKDMNKYHELLDKRYQREIKSGTIVNKDRNTPKETIYDVDGRVCGSASGGDPHQDGRTSKAIKNIFNKHLTYRINGRAEYTDPESKIKEYNSLNSNEIYGAGLHPIDIPQDPEIIENWFKFLYKKDPKGKKRMTVTDLMETYIIPNDLIIHERCGNTVWDGDERRTGSCEEDRNDCEGLEPGCGTYYGRCDRGFADKIYLMGR